MRPSFSERQIYSVKSGSWFSVSTVKVCWNSFGISDFGISQLPYPHLGLKHRLTWWAGLFTWKSHTGRAPSQYLKRRLSVRSRKVSKPQDLYLELSDRFEIWQALRQQCCWCACHISKRYDNFKYQSRGFETLRDLTERRLFGYWDGAQVVLGVTLIPGYDLISLESFDPFLVVVSVCQILSDSCNCKFQDSLSFSHAV